MRVAASAAVFRLAVGAALAMSVTAPARSAPAATETEGEDLRVPSTGEASADKSRYHLFRRAPRALMREMATDRPDTTESPISVDAGHLQLEAEIANVERDKSATSHTLGSLNLKLGIASWTDFQVVFDVFRSAGAQSDVGDLTLRNKINLWGNDGGSSALAVMPFVTLPASALGPGYTEGGLIVPLGLDGPAAWELGTMVEFDVVRRERTYGMDLVATATAGHALWEPLRGFVEIASVTPVADEPIVLSGNSGLVLCLSDDWMLDGGVRLGLTDSAPDIAAFIGGSGRY